MLWVAASAETRSVSYDLTDSLTRVVSDSGKSQFRPNGVAPYSSGLGPIGSMILGKGPRSSGLKGLKTPLRRILLLPFPRPQWRPGIIEPFLEPVASGESIEICILAAGTSTSYLPV